MYGGQREGLFHGPRLSEVARERTLAALAKVEKADVDELLSRDVEHLVEESINPFAPASIRWGDVTMTEPQQVQVSGSQDWLGRPTVRTMARSVLSAPVDGEVALLTYRADSGTPMSAIEGTPGREGITFTWTGELDADPQAIATWFQHCRTEVERFLVFVNRDIEPLNHQMGQAIRSEIERRRDQELKRRRLAASLPFPVERRPGATVPVRVERRVVRLESRPKIPTFAPEPAMAIEVYEEILRDCASVATIFERMPVARVGEEHLRNVILAMLNTNYTGQVGGELFNGAGKTDICIRDGDRNVFIGECKFYKGPASVTKAIEQLLSYLVWRDTKAALLLFVRGGDFTKIVTKAVETTAGHPQCQRHDPAADPSRRNYFVFTRADDEARSIHLALLPFRLPR